MVGNQGKNAISSVGDDKICAQREVSDKHASSETTNIKEQPSKFKSNIKEQPSKFK